VAAPESPVRRVVLLRHGRTAWNAIGRGQGHSDVELDDTGHDQARHAAPFVAAYGPALVRSSDLARARQTAAYVAKEAGLDVTYDARLREFDLGERTGLTMEEFAERFPAQHASFLEGRWEPLPGAEREEEVQVRYRAALEDVARELAPGETAIVVSHGGAIRLGAATMLRWPADVLASVRSLGNCHWLVLECEPAPDGSIEAARWRLAAWNTSAPDPDFTSTPTVG
jgi:broad specificity phosphatase PhoE